MTTPEPVIWAIRTLIWFAALAVGLVAAATWLPPYFNRVQVPPDYEDLGGLIPMTGVWLTAPPYFPGDGLAYRTGDGPEDIGFGIIAGMPGDNVRLVGGDLLVEDADVPSWKEFGTYRGIYDIGPMTVPAGHYFVVSRFHQRDSMVLGVIGPDQILGKVRE